MIPNGSKLRNKLIENGWTPDQLNILDAHLEDTYFNEYEYECADNLRLARVDNPEECAEYDERRDDGCCGFYDQEIEHPDGNILVGFNYGH